MTAADGRRKLAVGGEPFCVLLGARVQKKNPFVVQNVAFLSLHGLSCVHRGHVTQAQLLASAVSHIQHVKYKFTDWINAAS